MARRRRRSYSRPRRVYRYVSRSRARSYAPRGQGKQIIDGLMAGAGGAIASKYIGNSALVQPAVNIGVGYFRRNSTLKTLGGVQLGVALANMFTGNGAGIGGGGGY